jgi:hypothetical protein
MDRQMGGFLVDLLSSSLSAAAGAVGTAMAGPVAGAAAAAGASSIVGSVASLVGVQSSQLQFLEAMNANLGGLLAGVESQLFRLDGQIGTIQKNLEIQLDGPWRTANTYLELASDPEQQESTRTEYLKYAREKLLDAYGVAAGDTRKGLIVQRLAAISLILGDLPSARRWLVESHPLSVNLIRQVAAQVQRLVRLNWDIETTARIIEAVEAKRAEDATPLLRRFLAGGAGAPPASGRRRRGPSLSDQERRWQRNLLDRTEVFWTEYITAGPEEREAVRLGGDVRSESLQEFGRVEALGKLWRMVEDLSRVRAACQELGASVHPYRLSVDLFPLAPARVSVVRARLFLRQ